jgi:hypothetical protein
VQIKRRGTYLELAASAILFVALCAFWVGTFVRNRLLTAIGSILLGLFTAAFFLALFARVLAFLYGLLFRKR